MKTNNCEWLILMNKSWMRENVTKSIQSVSVQAFYLILNSQLNCSINLKLISIFIVTVHQPKCNAPLSTHSYVTSDFKLLLFHSLRINPLPLSFHTLFLHSILLSFFYDKNKNIRFVKIIFIFWLLTSKRALNITVSFYTHRVTYKNHIQNGVFFSPYKNLCTILFYSDYLFNKKKKLL